MKQHARGNLRLLREHVRLVPQADLYKRHQSLHRITTIWTKMKGNILTVHQIKIMSSFLAVTVLLSSLSITEAQVYTRASFVAEKMYSLENLQMDTTSVKLLKNSTGNNYDLVMLSYEPRSEIKYIPDIGQKLMGPFENIQFGTKIVTDDNILKYPNSVGVLPPNSLDSQPAYVWWIATGVFDKKYSFRPYEGSVSLIDMTLDHWRPFPIYKEKNVGFSYAEWYDMDLDKKKDCITVKGNADYATLIWLKQPRGKTGDWSPHPISNGTDVGGMNFRVMRVRRAGTNKKMMLIIVAGRRTRRLNAFWNDDPDNDWTQTSKLRSMDIAGGSPTSLRDSYVSVEIVDLNGDGINEVLTSVSTFANTPGRIVSFQLPKGGFNHKKLWRRRTLYEFPMAKSFGTVFPGPSFAFNPPSQTAKKPHILISGANEGYVYTLIPKSWSPINWTYSIQIIHSSKMPVGIPTAADVNGDGNVEIIIPEDYVSYYRYKLFNSCAQVKSTWSGWNLLIFVATMLFTSYSC